MKTTTLILSAMIATLPAAVNATQTIVETNTPAAVGSNGTVNRAATAGPYQTATIGEHDDEHIATTAYVKGAYNDAIAAVNKVDSTKQNQLVTYDDNIISDNVYGYYDFLYSLTNEEPSDLDGNLVTSGAVLAGIKSQRATIYTTWDDDSATTDVAFKTVYEEDED